MKTIDAPITFCLDCLGTDLQFVEEPMMIFVGKEEIEITVEYFKCMNCGEEMEADQPDYDPLQDAYDEYERRTGIKWRGNYR